VTQATSFAYIDPNQELLRGGALNGIASEGAKASCIAMAFTPKSIEGCDIAEPLVQGGDPK
jgi:hypothetical protein